MIRKWKPLENTFEGESEELAALVTADGCMRQIFDRNFKVSFKTHI